MLANVPADPAVLFAEEVEDLLLEARNYLDGNPIENEEQATAVASLLNRLRRVGNDADDARKAEKRPHDEAGKAVQEKWRPILAKADLAADTAKQALAPWLAKVEAEQRAEAEAKRQAAAELARIAAEQHRATDLAGRERAEQLLKDADKAAKAAAKADKAKPLATGGERAIGLVDLFTPVLTDPVLAFKYYRESNPEDLKEWLVEQARKDVRLGARVIPGFTIEHTRAAR